jgi:hypothetical protein
MIQELPESDCGETIVQLPKMHAVDVAATAVVEVAAAAVVVDVGVPPAGGGDDGAVVNGGEPLLLEFDEQADSAVPTSNSTARAKGCHALAEGFTASGYPHHPPGFSSGHI